jgi:hypothetical protein
VAPDGVYAGDASGGDGGEVLEAPMRESRQYWEDRLRPTRQPLQPGLCLAMTSIGPQATTLCIAGTACSIGCKLPGGGAGIVATVPDTNDDGLGGDQPR